MAPFNKSISINLKKVSCPKCGTRQPFFRLPKNRQQVLWGGWTCSNCGCEMDRFGAQKDKRSA